MTSLLLLRHATRPLSSLAGFGGTRSESLGRELLTIEAECARGILRLVDSLHAAAGGKSEVPDRPASRTRWAILSLKRAVHNGRSWRPEDLAAASSGLPSSILEALSAHRRVLESRERAECLWATAFAADLAAGRRAILATTKDPLVACAIALASGSLHAKVRDLPSVEPENWGHAERHVAAKALSYIVRFATKTSPNSLFCATALAEAVGPAAAVTGRPEIARRDVILNVAECRKIACVLAADPAVEDAVIPRPNPTLREEEGGWTFWRFASPRNATDDESLSRVREHPVLRATLEESSARVPFPELMRRVAARCGLDSAQLVPFLRQTVERGILIAEIEIPYNERRPLRFVATRPVRRLGSTQRSRSSDRSTGSPR